MISADTTELLIAEKAFLSSVLADPDSLGEIDSLNIDPDDFVEFKNRLVFQQAYLHKVKIY